MTFYTQADLDELYRRIIFSDAMHGALNLLTQKFNAHAGTVFLFKDGLPHITAASNINNELAQKFNLDFAAKAPLRKHALTAPVDEILTVSACIGVKNLHLTDSYKFVLAPSDVEDILMFRFLVGGALRGFTICRARGREFNRDDVRNAAGLVSHIRRAFLLRFSQTGQRPTEKRISDSFGLTAREAEIANMLNQGVCRNDLCNRINVSRNTLKWHLKNIYQKLDVKSHPEMILKLSSKNHITPPQGVARASSPGVNLR
ncbi:helix-turn-helix transcriptional regulator [Hyphococcus sp.]|uniref:helix-turn-helix transcriptional regulator n=1 Tax=Hyphococcus sp. TaxID=2038636 RepID=UPI003CCBC59B